MQDRIKQMAVEVGLLEPRDEWATVPADYRTALVSFARLVAEDCARVCEDDAKATSDPVLDLIEESRAGYVSGARNCADAIRARYAETKEG